VNQKILANILIKAVEKNNVKVVTNKEYTNSATTEDAI